jgi:hypothetical protein
MTVESWDPGAASTALTEPRLSRLLEAARHPDAADFGLGADEIRDLAPVARQARRGRPGADWAAAAAALADGDLVALVRFFTLAEARLAGWEARDASPVVPLAALLKRRGAYPADLTAWIKANSDNRFLPHGNLMDRL